MDWRAPCKLQFELTNQFQHRGLEIKDGKTEKKIVKKTLFMCIIGAVFDCSDVFKRKLFFLLKFKKLNTCFCQCFLFDT